MIPGRPGSTAEGKRKSTVHQKPKILGDDGAGGIPRKSKL